MRCSTPSQTCRPSAFAGGKSLTLSDTTTSTDPERAAAHIGKSNGSLSQSARVSTPCGSTSTNASRRSTIMAFAAFEHARWLAGDSTPPVRSNQSHVRTRFSSAMIHGDQTATKTPDLAAPSKAIRVRTGTSTLVSRSARMVTCQATSAEGDACRCHGGRPGRLLLSASSSSCDNGRSLPISAASSSRWRSISDTGTTQRPATVAHLKAPVRQRRLIVLMDPPPSRSAASRIERVRSGRDRSNAASMAAKAATASPRATDARAASRFFRMFSIMTRTAALPRVPVQA